MSKKQLKIKLLPNGEIQMETVGIKGKKCEEYIAFFEQISNAKIKEIEHTKEYFEQEITFQQDNINETNY